MNPFISQLQQRKIELDFIDQSKWRMIDLMPWAHFANVFVLIEDSNLPDTTCYLPIDNQNPFRSVRRIHDFPSKLILHFMTIGSNAKRLSDMSKVGVIIGFMAYES